MEVQIIAHIELMREGPWTFLTTYDKIKRVQWPKRIKKERDRIVIKSDTVSYTPFK